MPTPLKVLIVEDEPADAELMLFELRQAGLHPEWERVETEEAYLSALSARPEVILADLAIPGFGALRALELLRIQAVDVPFLVVTGDAREETVVQCMRAGASDFLVKDRLGRLAGAVELALAAKRLRDEKARVDDELGKYRADLEMLVKERTAQLLVSEQRAELLRDVASAANAARSSGEALLGAIRCVAGHWGWPVGHAFLLETSTGRLVDSGYWHLTDSERFQDFLKVAAPSQLGQSDAFFRSALESGLPAWTALPPPPHLFRRDAIARAAGLGYVCALPVSTRDRIFAILEFLGEGDGGVAPDDLEVMRQVSLQVGVTCERLESEATLRKLSLAVTQSPAAVIVTDRDGRIEYVNPAFESSTGFSAREGIGQNPRILKSGLHAVSFYDELWGTILKGETWRGEICNRRKNGDLFWESTSISPLRSETGEVSGFVAVNLDLSERKEVERQLEKAKDEAEQANRAKSAFLANISHEIRTPLNAVLGFSQLMMDDRGLTRVQREHLDAIRRGGEHLLELINDLLEASRIVAGPSTLNPVSVDLPLLLEDVERTFRPRAQEKSLSFEIQRVGALPRHVVIDETKLREILGKLLGNAMKFTRQGGVLVTVRSVSSRVGEIRLIVDIEDTGPGIAENDLPRLFQRFERAHDVAEPAGGTGLGLALGRAFARQMGGDITVRSRPGVGSVFTVEVSAAVDEQATPRESPPTGRVRGLPQGEGRRRVLVADDTAANREVASAMLRRVGFQVRTANDGAGALALFREWRPNAVLMDLRMPGMVGLEAIRTLRKLEGGESVPVLALTGGAPEEDRKRVLEAGGNGILGKPFREADLLWQVGTALGVEYAMETEADGEEASEIPTAIPEIPEPLRGELWAAVVRADLGRVLDLAALLEREDPMAAALVRDLAERFEYRQLLEILGKRNADG